MRDQHRESDSEERSVRDGSGESQERGSSRSRRDGVSPFRSEAGNQAIQRMHETGDLQTKLSVSQPDDPAEREAERMAQRVVRSSASASNEGADQTVHRSPGGESTSTSAVEEAAKSRIRALDGGGESLSQSIRAVFETRFGRDFGDVRVHTGPQADEAVRTIGAEAFTLGRDVVFRQGAYRPSTPNGKRLLAHELTHVVQQTGPEGSQSAGETVQRQSTEETIEELPDDDQIPKDATKAERVEFHIENARDDLEEIKEQQKSAFVAVRNELQEADQPSLGEALIKEAVAASLFFAATRLIGAAVKAYSTLQIESEVGKKVFQDARGKIEDVAFGAAKANVGGGGSSQGRTVLEQFVTSQKQSIGLMINAQKEALNAAKIRLKDRKDGVEIAKGIADALQSVLDSRQAFHEQYLAAMGEWGNLLSGGTPEFGKEEGEKLGGRLVSSSNARVRFHGEQQGKLNIHVRGDPRSMASLTITDVNWPGINQSGRKSLQQTYGNRKVEELGVNIRVIFTTETEGALDQSSRFTFDYYPREKEVEVRETGTPIYELAGAAGGRDLQDKQKAAIANARTIGFVLEQKRLSELPLSG